MQHGVISLDLWGYNGWWGQEFGHFLQGKGLGKMAADSWEVNSSKGVVVSYVVGL